MGIRISLFLIILLSAATIGCTQNKNQKTMEYKKLTPEEENVIVNKGTERMCVSAADLRFIARGINSMPVAAGLLLMMRYREQ